MVTIGDQEKLEILINKAKVYLSFSLSFASISFPLISLSFPTSLPGLPELIVISLLSFVFSILFSFSSFKALNSLKENNEPETINIKIFFYSNLIDLAYFANISGFFFIVLYLSFLLTYSIFMLFFTAGAIAFFFIIIKLMKKYCLDEIDNKKVRIYIILGFMILLIIAIGSLILTL